MSFTDPGLGVKSFFPSNLAIKKKRRSGVLLHASGIIVGRFQVLKSLRHAHLVPYYDIIKRKQERLFIISEAYERTLQDELNQRLISPDEGTIRRLMFQMLDALVYLESYGIYHKNLSLKNIYVDSKFNIKFSDYGIGYMTDYGRLANFVIGDPHYMSPETLADGLHKSRDLLNTKCDVWSLGIICLELALGKRIFDGEDNFTTMLQVLSFVGHQIDIDKVKEDYKRSKPLSLNEYMKLDPLGVCKLTPQQRSQQYENLKKNQKVDQFISQLHFSDEFKEVIRYCLDIDSTSRASALDMVEHPYFKDLLTERKSKVLWMVAPGAWAPLLERDESDPWRQYVEEKTEKEFKKESGLTTHLFRTPKKKRRDLFDANEQLSLKELYFIWKSTSHNIENDLVPELKMAPPILRIPIYINSKAFDTSSPQATRYKHGYQDESRLYSDKVLKLSYHNLESILSQRSEKLRQDMDQTNTINWSAEQKEMDLDYQRLRIRIFKALLPELPESRFHISKEAKKDIPPILRGDIWAAILEVPPSYECKKIYDRIDNESIGPADNQIDLDIPRCHQYHELLSSEEGHRKFKRILKAWVQYNPKLGYWQGIDSLLAPFLCLHFNEESKAFMCLQRIIEKFSKNLFDKDNAVYLQEHLHILTQILSYNDPELAMHLHDIGFHPNLYAIPWFITLFTHLFSMEQIYRLWDKLLMSTSQLPFFIAYSMLKKLREILLPLDFNSCILLFSSLPSVNIDEVIKEAQDVSLNTPESVTMPKYIIIDHEVSNLSLFNLLNQISNSSLAN